MGAVHRPRLRAGAFADTDELTALSETVAGLGGFYHTHTRSDLRAEGAAAPWEEAVEIGRRSGIPVHLTHYRQGRQGQGSHLDYLGLVEDARSEGLDVTFDLLLVPLLRHDSGHRLPGVVEGRRPGATSGCPEGPGRPRPDREGAAASGAGE